VAYFKDACLNSLEKLRKTIENLGTKVDVPDKIRIRHRPITGQKRYRLSQRARYVRAYSRMFILSFMNIGQLSSRIGAGIAQSV
jgi:hypothetical protein